jgi:peptidoglycan/xylan/chitin deacetylase (PgdA/CDA1 family)
LRDFWSAGRRRVARELDDSLQALQAAGAEVRLYRSPVGIKNIFLQSTLQARGLRCVAWTVRSGDGTGKCLETIVSRVLVQARAGSIILMHEGESVAEAVRVEALEAVLRGLHARGFQCVLPEDATLLPA